MSDSLQSHGLHSPWDSPGKNTRWGCHFLLQGIVPTQGSNPWLQCLLHWQTNSLTLGPPEKPLSGKCYPSNSSWANFYREQNRKKAPLWTENSIVSRRSLGQGRTEQCHYKTASQQRLPLPLASQVRECDLSTGWLGRHGGKEGWPWFCSSDGSEHIAKKTSDGLVPLGVIVSIAPSPVPQASVCQARQLCALMVQREKTKRTHSCLFSSATLHLCFLECQPSGPGHAFHHR